MRLFLASHLYGPFIGLALAAFLLLLGFPFDDRLLGFAGLVSLFWLYRLPLARGVPYVGLCLVSLQHLCFIIAWGSYGYGGLDSPFLLWLAVVPLLAFLYLSPSVRLLLLLIAMIAATALGLAIVSILRPPPAVDQQALQWLALVSVVCASIYVSMMAVHFGRMLDSRDAVERDAARHEEAAADLERLAKALRGAGAAKAEMIGRIGREAASPLAEIGAACDLLKRHAATGAGIGAADLRSIAEAARYLTELVRDVELYAGLNADAVPMQAAYGLSALLRDAAAKARAGKAGPVVVEPGEEATLVTDQAMLEAALVHVLRHLGHSALGRPLKLRGSRLPAEQGDHIVIDIFKAAGPDPSQVEEGIRSPRDGEARGGGLGLALAGRMVAAVGGSLGRHPGRPDGSHFRIELPGVAAV